MSVWLFTEIRNGYVVNRTYSCLCGRGIIKEQQDYTPVYKDGIAFFRFKYWEKRCQIGFGTS